MSSRTVDDLLNKMGVQGGMVSRTVDQNGVVRMKILVKRHELEQVLDRVAKKTDHNKQNHVSIRYISRSPASKSLLDQRLKDMKRMRILKSRQIKGNCRGSWRPALQSIPEAVAF
ncbi:hypothetical protein Tco_1185528 [Tanacetum coccineum]